jgi:hypothetical protein
MTSWTVSPAGDSWDPSRLLDQTMTVGPQASPAVRLGDLVELVPPEPLSPAVTEWVTPAAVSEESGTAVVRLQYRPERAGYRLGVNLRAGDVLVPRHGLAPCVVVDPATAGVAFTEGFIALRPQRHAHPAVLWALLSSRSGTRARKQLLAGTAVPRMAVDALLELPLHLPPVALAHYVEALLPEPRVDRTVDQPRRTSWTMADPRDGQWAEVIVTTGLGFEPGRRLEDIARVLPGTIRAHDRSELPLPGFVPVCLPENARRNDWTAKAWAQPRPPLTDGWSFVLPAVRRYRAGSPPPGWVVGHDAYLISPLEPGTATDLIAWISGPQGQAILERFSHTTFIPRLSLSALRGLPVPRRLPAASRPSDALGRGSLADRLEAVWR